MDTRTLTVGLVSLGLFAGAGALVFAHSGPALRPAYAAGLIARIAPAVCPPDEDNNDEDDDNDDEEQVITFDQAPAPVQAAALKLAGDAKNISQVTREEVDVEGGADAYAYEIEYTENGAKCSAEFTDAGDLIEMEKSIDASKIPAAALAALKEEYPDATFSDTKVVTKTVYVMTIKVDGKDHEIQVSALGDIEDDNCCDDEGDSDSEHDEDTPMPAAGPGSHSDPA